MMYIFFLFLFEALYSGRPFCIDIDYCTYDIYGLWKVFMVVYLWLCVWICIYGCRFMGSYGCISGCMAVFFGYVFMAMAMCLWLGVWVSGLDPPRGPVQ